MAGPLAPAGAGVVSPAGEVEVLDICGAPLGRWEGTFALRLGIEPVYVLGRVERVSLAAPPRTAP